MAEEEGGSIVAQELHLVVDGRQVLTRVAPRLSGSAVLLPLRPVLESVGGTVDFEAGPPQRALASFAKRTGQVEVGSLEALVAGQPLPLPAPPAVVDDTMIVPAAFLDALGLRSELDLHGIAVLCGLTDSRLAGEHIFVDPGHGGRDPGSVGRDGLREADVNLDVCLQTERLLNLAGAAPTLSRTSDRTISLKARVALAETRRAALFACVHTNSFNDPSPHGIETYYYETWGGHKLAAAVQAQLVGELGLTDRGIKEAGFYVLRHTTVPACLAEVAFVSNPDEERLLADPWFRLRAALAIYRGVREFMESATARLG